MKGVANFTIVVLVCLGGGGGLGHGQNYGDRLGLQRGGKVSFEPRGPGVMFGALDPTVKKWYVPQELYQDYAWRQWEYSNYSKDRYQRYVNTTLEGDYFYDFYGNFIGRGWLIYDWRQNQPQQLGSGIFQDGRFNSWFSNVTVGGDAKGQYHYAITVGTQLRTTLTPMTFSKPRFNGVQMDFTSDKYAATVLASRVSEPISSSTPEPVVRTNTTSLFGGRAVVQLGDFIEVGATLVDARHANTELDLFSGDLIAGSLTAGQSSTPTNAIAVILSDDSPEDGEAGAALFRHDVRIVSRDFETGLETMSALQEVVRAGDEWPVVFGGVDRSGFVAANGLERIVLNYDFADPAYIGPDPTSIVKVEFDYILANDFKIEMWSDRQTGLNPIPTPPLSAEIIDDFEPALLKVRQAPGNVKDISNLQRVQFDYGLPTGNLVGGFTIAGTDLLGFDFYGEWDRNKRYSQYPNAALFNAGENHKISSAQADAWHFNLSRRIYPWFGFAEVYAFDEDYSTTAFLTNANGDVLYDNDERHFYEFVEDNDDQDRTPDWRRASQSRDGRVFPGWDENNDFISDFNQNDTPSVPNAIPDYEEPFLRYEVDRPEFLFGIDANNNNWIDRFEDDDLPDYPYKTDRRGYNAFVGGHLGPEARLTLGRIDEEMQSEARANRTTYALLTFDRDYPGLGRLQAFEMLKRSEDSIPDDRRESTAFILGAVARPLVQDLLPAQDTWINTAYLGFAYRGIPRLNLINKFKCEIFHQNQDGLRASDGRLLAENASFVGLINKLDYEYGLGRLDLQPRFKSEYRRQTAFQQGGDKRVEWSGTAQLLGHLPVLERTLIQAGVELLWLRELVQDEDELAAQASTGPTGDLRSRNLALQLSNSTDYLGYRLTTQIGLRIGRIGTEVVREVEPGAFDRDTRSDTEAVSFITVYAGVQ